MQHLVGRAGKSATSILVMEYWDTGELKDTLKVIKKKKKAG